MNGHKKPEVNINSINIQNTMKATHFILAAMAATVLAWTPSQNLWAAAPPDKMQLADTAKVHFDTDVDIDRSGQKPKVKVAVKGMTVNGHPATKQEKAVAKDMVRQGTRMADKGVQMAKAALTDPDKAEKLGDELEAMGDEMERMGDSLAALSEDTTFLYDGDEESDSLVLAQEDIDEIVNGLDEIGSWFGDSWLGKFFGGSLGLLAGGFSIAVVLLILFFLLIIFTSPLWIAALIFYFIGRNDRKVRQQRQARAYAASSSYVHDASATASNPVDSAEQSPSDASNAASTRESAERFTREDSTTPIESPDNDTWTSGVRQCCLGVGLIIFFVAFGWESLWGIGAIVACLGVSKLIIAYSAKRKANNYSSTRESAEQFTREDSTYSTDTTTSSYDK